MKELDKDRDGYINLEEFKAAVGFEVDGTMATNAASFNNGMPLPPMPSDDKEKTVINIPPPVLAAVKVKVRKVTKFNPVWNSQGSMSRQKISKWEPVVSAGAFGATKIRFPFGHLLGQDTTIQFGTEKIVCASRSRTQQGARLVVAAGFLTYWTSTCPIQPVSVTHGV
jgi:hypothetical protein